MAMPPAGMFVLNVCVVSLFTRPFLRARSSRYKNSSECSLRSVHIIDMSDSGGGGFLTEIVSSFYGDLLELNHLSTFGSA
jgi:hypothetical protein